MNYFINTKPAKRHLIQITKSSKVHRRNIIQKSTKQQKIQEKATKSRKNNKNKRKIIKRFYQIQKCIWLYGFSRVVW